MPQHDIGPMGPILPPILSPQPGLELSVSVDLLLEVFVHRFHILLYDLTQFLVVASDIGQFETALVPGSEVGIHEGAIPFPADLYDLSPDLNGFFQRRISDHEAVKMTLELGGQEVKLYGHCNDYGRKAVSHHE